MADNEYMKMLKYGDWLADFLAPDLDGWKLRKLAVDGLGHLDVHFSLPVELDPVVIVAESLERHKPMEGLTFLENAVLLSLKLYGVDIPKTNFSPDGELVYDAKDPEIIKRTEDFIKVAVKEFYRRNKVRYQNVERNGLENPEGKVPEELQDIDQIPFGIHVLNQLFVLRRDIINILDHLYTSRETWKGYFAFLHEKVNEMVLDSETGSHKEGINNNINHSFANITSYYSCITEGLGVVDGEFNSVRRLDYRGDSMYIRDTFETVPVDVTSRDFTAIPSWDYEAGNVTDPWTYWQIVASRIFFDFFMMGGQDYYGFCEYCGKFFVVQRKGRKKYCSDTCRAKACQARVKGKENSIEMICSSKDPI